MNLNELINKYEDKAKKYKDKYNFWKEKTNYSMMGDCETKIESYQEILSDLEQLKDKIYGSNDYTLMIQLKKEIIGE